jgi:ribosomal protein L25 (general stress protein Ctc)
MSKNGASGELRELRVNGFCPGIVFQARQKPDLEEIGD